MGVGGDRPSRVRREIGGKADDVGSMRRLAAPASPAADVGSGLPAGPVASAARSRRKLLRQVGRNALVVAASVLVYYLNPAPFSGSRVVAVFWAILTVGGGALIVVRQVRARIAESRAASDRQVVGLETLANVLVVVAIAFAGTYLFLSRRSGQMEGIRTHTDALYFSMTVLSTVGFGDIRATGQLSRIIVTTQMLFDLVFVASIIGLVVSSMASRTQTARTAGRPDPNS
jgi:hypothetical protein